MLSAASVAQSSSLGTGFVVVWLAIVVFYVAAGWRLFSKAGRPGWGAIIPIYNAYLWIKIAGRPGWWLVLFFIPLLNIIVALILAIDVARAFGKTGGFGFGLFLLSFIFLPILAFGAARYEGPRPTPLA
ncbi:MAG TPA: DUF5684 domain-containing protein [Acidimicrobiales bacterium]